MKISFHIKKCTKELKEKQHIFKIAATSKTTIQKPAPKKTEK